MWWLKKPLSAQLSEYENLLLDGLMERINSSEFPHKDVLTESVLKKLLIAEPQEHYQLNCHVMSQIIEQYDEKDFENLTKYKRKKSLTVDEQILINKYANLDVILSLFDYEGQISQSKSKSYKIAKYKDINTCPYCNRQYIFTVIKGDGKNNTERISRPVFDHWFCKELYPLLSLNYFNLIPSCSCCNSGAKGNKIFNLSTHIHPYCHEGSQDFTFMYKAGINGGWDVNIDKETSDKVKTMIADFCLRELYHNHGNLEVADLIELTNHYSAPYIRVLLQEVLRYMPDKSEDAIFRMIYGTELLEEKELDRPLSKLKRDILTQLGVIIDGHIS